MSRKNLISKNLWSKYPVSQNTIFSVKVFQNIDNINNEIINDIKSLSTLLKSKPLLMSESQWIASYQPNGDGVCSDEIEI